ncbi:MAG: DUF1003 domain-containing protein [Fulvimarina manganoxydans]|uniref:DUF1003 domain-containing protein n=1 Tax=Fulvimarina manganoxydans TaxID=937218 RepID=UPI002356EA25|nr:DUF1003 domain-containing protein [Fulvimarina manganoxydans]MCK5933848.1 DUF1003 domain-containing protein [Fulvimarina manganoxydans]
MDKAGGGPGCDESPSQAKAPRPPLKWLRLSQGRWGPQEKAVAEALADNRPVAVDTAREADRSLTFGERAADAVAQFGGSWTFILLFAAILIGWMGLNVTILARDAFDPYPFILLNLVLSCLAAVQAPIIMMSQKRQDERDRIAAQNDYQVNLKAELEICELREAIHGLREDHRAIVAAMREEIDELRRMREELKATGS